MMRHHLRRATPFIAVISVAACSGSPSPAASANASAEASEQAAGECSAVTLLSPTGEIVDLTGTWAGTGILASDDETALLNQIGGCVYGSVNGVDSDGSRAVVNLSGPVNDDFTVDTEVVMVLQETVFKLREYSTMVLLIEWDADGRIRLREDRAPGERAERCVQSPFECPDPIIWYRLEDGPSS